MKIIQNSNKGGHLVSWFFLAPFHINKTELHAKVESGENTVIQSKLGYMIDLPTPLESIVSSGYFPNLMQCGPWLSDNIHTDGISNS